LARVDGGEPSPGPSAADVAAAAEMPADQQAAMIEGMVSGLAERLKKEPDDVEGWLRLIRSYAVLGRSDDAAKAAHSALAGVSDAEDRERVAALMVDLGLDTEARPQ
jgi:cytochrome c-type biogenesis protein CcmH